MYFLLFQTRWTDGYIYPCRRKRADAEAERRYTSGDGHPMCPTRTSCPATSFNSSVPQCPNFLSWIFTYTITTRVLSCKGSHRYLSWGFYMAVAEGVCLSQPLCFCVELPYSVGSRQLPCSHQSQLHIDHTVWQFILQRMWNSLRGHSELLNVEFVVF